MKEYLKHKIEELEINSQVTNIWDLEWDINDFKKGYQPSTNMVKDEKGDLVPDSRIFWLGGIITSRKCWMYMELIMLGRRK